MPFALERGLARPQGDTTTLRVPFYLLANKKLSDAEYARLSASFDEAQRFEIVQLVGFYHSVSLLCGAFALPNEAGTATIPTA